MARKVKSQSPKQRRISACVKREMVGREFRSAEAQRNAFGRSIKKCAKMAARRAG